MKKIALFSIIVSLTFIFGAFAEDLPDWTKKTEPWTETFEQEYVYAVGTAHYTEKMSDAEFNSNFDSARTIAISQIKDLLKVQQLIGYQIIDQEYQEPKMYVLIAVPKALNKATDVVRPAKPPEQAISENQAIEAANKINIAHYETLAEVPKDWWTLFKPLPQKNPAPKDYIANVFRVGNMLYAIGFTFTNSKIKNPKASWEAAGKGARAEALRNLAAALNGIYCQAGNKKGDYTLKINGFLKGNQFSNAKIDGIENPHRIEDSKAIFVLISAPISTINQFSK